MNTLDPACMAYSLDGNDGNSAGGPDVKREGSIAPPRQPEFQTAAR